MINKINGRLSFLVLFFALLFVTGILVDKSRVEKEANELFLIREKEKNELFDKLFILQGRSLELFTYDYTYWDEMVNFVYKPDLKWAAINIDLVLASYNTQYACVYNKSLNVIYTVNTTDTLNKTMEILPQYVLKEIFDKRWFNHFFIKTGKGILEIRTAPIQPSADIKRETTPQGFFVAGRIWSNEYIDELGKLIESKIEILPADLYSNNKNTSSDTIIIERQLLEWNNNPLITLRAVSEYDIVKARVMESSNMEFIFSLIFVTVLIIILFYFIYHWISKPLLKLTRALETEDTNKIGSLKKSKSEFGLLANLIENFLSQKKELVKEIKEHVDTKQLLEHIASTSPALITVFDIDSQKNIYQNRSILSDLNYTEEEIKEITSHSNVPTLNLIHEDDNAIIEDFYNNLSTLRDDENREMEYRIKDKFGYWHWIRRIYSVFHRDKYGYPSQIVSVFENITNKKLAEEELKISEQYYRNLFESAHDAIIIFRPDNENILDVNEQACKLYGFTRDEMLKMSLQDVSEDVERGKGLIKETLDKNFVQGLNTVHHSKNGKKMYIESNGAVINFKNEKAIIAINRDVTAKKNAENQILSSLKEKEILVKEVHHRVKNNLQVISSLLKLQSEYINDTNDREIFRESQNRVKTMALIHEKLYRSRDIARIDFGDYIQNLASSLMLTYGVNLHKIKLNFEFDKIFFDVDTAIPCGLLINELVSNCIKHAFGKNDSGEINLAMKVDDNDKYSLVVKDNGKGFPKNIDFRNTKSLGMQLVVTLADQLDADINMENHLGTTFTITFNELKYKER